MEKNPPANAEDLNLIPGLGRSPGGGNSNTVQYSCLENPPDRRAHGLQSTGLQRVEPDLAAENIYFLDCNLCLSFYIPPVLLATIFTILDKCIYIFYTIKLLINPWNMCVCVCVCLCVCMYIYFSRCQRCEMQFLLVLNCLHFSALSV